jgi:hypothetical protein
MNKRWKLTLKNINKEEEQLKDCLQFFEQWWLDTVEYRKDDGTISRQHRELFFLSTQTYRNMKFSICGFVEYARDVLSHHPTILFVTSGHSNTSTLESRFSLAKHGWLNDMSKYHLGAANIISIGG